MSSNGSFVLNVNGDEYSATSAVIRLFKNKYVGVRTINWKEEVPRTPQDGMGGVSIGRTRGVYKASVSVEIIKSQGDRLIYQLQVEADRLGLDGWGDVPFNVEAKLREAAPLGLSAIDILGCKYVTHEEGIQTGGEAVVQKIELSVIRPIRRTINGKVCTMVRDPIDNNGIDTIINSNLSVSG